MKLRLNYSFVNKKCFISIMNVCHKKTTCCANSQIWLRYFVNLNINPEVAKKTTQHEYLKRNKINKEKSEDPFDVKFVYFRLTVIELL